MDRLALLTAAIPQPPNPRPEGPDRLLRRMLFRLKAGLMRPPSGVDRATMIDALERELEYRRQVRLVMAELDAIRTIFTSEIETKTAGLMEQAVAILHAAKQLPEAADPNSELSEWIRRMDRDRRTGSGRPQRK
jgi:hypothetical protein